MADLVQFRPGAGAGVGSGADGVVRAEGVGWFDPGEITSPPPEGGPEMVAAWWAALTPRGKAPVVADYPGWVANLDGIPFGARDAANRARVAGLEERVRGELARAEQRLGEAPQQLREVAGEPDPAQDAARENTFVAAAEVQRLRGQLDALTKLQDILTQDDRRLLVLDLPEGALPRAAVAVGDLDAADKVAVLVPGFTSTVAGMGTNVDDMATMRDTTVELLQGEGDSTSSVATVAWLDYDIPQHWDEVAVTERAESGGRDLAGFLGGVNAARETDPDLTVLGHSYGSTTTGYGLQQPGAGVDDVVFFGSPGVGTDEVSALRVPEGSVWYAEATPDFVGDLHSFGADLSAMPGVQHLETGPAVTADGQQLAGVTGHSFYLKPDTTSQYNLAAVVAGHPELTIEGNNLDGLDRHPWRPWQ
ncbi:MAG: alpha/beta hydrolase [Dermatophilaceae bacterium]